MFFGEEYKQYLTFSVEISTNTLLCNYSEHLWSDEQEHTHKRIESLHDSGKGYRTIAKLLHSIYLAVVIATQRFVGNGWKCH